MAFDLSLQAVDANGTLQTGYEGLVHFASSDRSATLPADYTFSQNDGGQHQFALATRLLTAGNQTILATDLSDYAIDANIQLAVEATAPHFAFGAGSYTSTDQGAPMTLVVIGPDPGTGPYFTGAISFSSSDASSVLPGLYTFSNSDNGVYTFSNVQLSTPGIQQITVTSVPQPNVSASYDVFVGAPTGPGFEIVGAPSNAIVGVPFTLNLRAIRPDGTTWSTFAGPAQVFIDWQTSVPVTLRPSDAGELEITTRFAAQGPGFVSINDYSEGALFGYGYFDSEKAVFAAPAQRLAFGLVPQVVPTNQAASFTLQALDSFGNFDGHFTGVVKMTADNANVQLPASYTLTTADQGQHLFANALTAQADGPTVLKATVGGSVADAYTSTAFDSQVVAGKPSKLFWFNPPVVTATQDFSATIVALDQSGIQVTNANSVVNVGGGNGRGGSFTFAAADKGIHQVTLTAYGWEYASFGAETSDYSASGSTSNLSVLAPSFQCEFGGFPQIMAVSRGSPVTFSVDVYRRGPSTSLYTGKLNLTSSDASAQFPGSLDFSTTPDTYVEYPYSDASVGNLTVTFNTRGNQWLLAQDPAGSQLGCIITLLVQ